MDPSQQAGH